MDENTKQFLGLGADHIERDFNRWVRRLGLDVEHYHIVLYLDLPDKPGLSPFELAFIPPHELFALLFEHGRDADSLVGSTGREGLQQFWEAYIEDPALGTHSPLLNSSGERVRTFYSRVPVAYHCDGGQARIGVTLLMLCEILTPTHWPRPARGRAEMDA